MCGRYSITGDFSDLERHVPFKGTRPENPRYNLAPRQQAPVLIWEGGTATTATLKPMRWGLIPSWAKDDKLDEKTVRITAGSIQRYLAKLAQ